MSAMNSEQFFLKWNNFESNLASGFADLLQREAMVDVTLAAEGRIVQAHKIILSICSSYFRNMFQANPCQHPIVVLKDVRYQELTDMLDFMYKGEANVRQEDLPSFLKLAETLRVKGLAGNHGELDENSREKNSDSQLSNLTKETSSVVREEPSNDFLERDTGVARKKSKRCTSPLVYTESKDLPHSPNIKSEMEECDNSVHNMGHIAVIKEERLSDNSIDSYGENHLMHESLEAEKNPGPSTVEDNSDTVPQVSGKKTSEYSFMKTCFGGHLLILDGFLYRRKSMSLGKSYWFCCSSKCTARGILRKDGEFQLTNSTHNHKPDLDHIKRKEKLLELKKLALEVNASGQELLDTLGINYDIKKHLNFIRTCRRRGRRITSTAAPQNVGLNYKLLPSQHSSKNLLLHSGYFYRQDSVNPRNNKLKYWRCRVRNCKARAKTDNLGNLTILNFNHNHSSEADKTEHRMKRDLWKVRKQKQGKESAAAVEESSFGTSAADSETFSFEKLMAETLAENYCVTTEFNEAFNC